MTEPLRHRVSNIVPFDLSPPRLVVDLFAEFGRQQLPDRLNWDHHIHGHPEK